MDPYVDLRDRLFFLWGQKMAGKVPPPIRRRAAQVLSDLRKGESRAYVFCFPRNRPPEQSEKASTLRPSKNVTRPSGMVSGKR